MFKIVKAAVSLIGVIAGHTWDDCQAHDSSGHGPFGPIAFHNQTWNDTIFYSQIPTKSDDRAFPLVVFMHGSTGQWEMYNENLEMYSSHGVVVVFPFVKSPEADKHFWTTNTDGTYLIKAIEYARAMNQDSTSPLFGLVDMENIVIAGHSMGATCSIAATHRLPAGTAKLTITQHPGICGPFGPPPSPNTWMPADLKDVSSKNPLLMTTARNDGAFWPAPLTASHEYGCFKKADVETVHDVAFVDFTADACKEDGDRKPFPDGGHCCPMKFKDGGGPETPWVLHAIKLYTHFDGDKSSQCHEFLWGDSADSLKNTKTAEIADVRPATGSKAEFLL